jgi:hypothetical protein
VKTLKFKKDSAVNSVVGTATSWTLGTDGEEVTALLANMPGGLELLPNKQYRNNDSWNRWLELIDDDGNREALPKSDPYREIYEQDDVYYRLVNEEWLNPGRCRLLKKTHILRCASVLACSHTQTVCSAA